MNSTVAILLATFNGARFLEAQLQSIAAQTHQNWRLIVSDDGSSDATRAVLSKFMADHPGKIAPIRMGPKAGFAQNFLNAVAYTPSDCDFAAFCDQDDVWMPDKLAYAIQQLQTPKPALYGSQRINCSADLRPVPTAASRVTPSFANALVQNFAGGNTMVLNRAAIRLLQSLLPYTMDVIYHDWWAYQCIAGAGGLLHFDPKPQVYYRQHGQNIIGENQSVKARLNRISSVLTGKHFHQLSLQLAVLKACQFRFTAHNRQILDAFIQSREAGVVHRLTTLQKHGITRQSRAGTASLYGASALGLL